MPVRSRGTRPERASDKSRLAAWSTNPQSSPPSLDSVGVREIPAEAFSTGTPATRPLSPHGKEILPVRSSRDRQEKRNSLVLLSRAHCIFPRGRTTTPMLINTGVVVRQGCLSCHAMSSPGFDTVPGGERPLCMSGFSRGTGARPGLCRESTLFGPLPPRSSRRHHGRKFARKPWRDAATSFLLHCWKSERLMT